MNKTRLFLAAFLCSGMFYTQICAAETAYGQILSESSIRLLSEEEIADMPLQVAAYAKNEIYARNGRMFRSVELQNYFGAQSWYTALYQPDQFTADMLNAYELQNLELLSDLEASLGPYVTDGEDVDYEEVYAYIESHQPERSGYETDPVSQIFYDSDRRLLTDEDLDGLTLQECFYAQCEIYARRGMIFDSLEMSDYFGQKNWYWGYIGEGNFDEDVLNTYETENIEALQDKMTELDPDGYQTDQAAFSYAGIGSYTAGASYAASAEDFVFRDSALRYLTDEEVSGLSLRMLCYARNEIYARRGYVFAYRELKDYFSDKCWYHASVNAAQFTEDVFNAYEAANIALLRSYEYSISTEGYRLY